MKRATVFSLVREQSVFMTAIMALLTFLAVMALGIAISIGTGVARWNAQWDLFATVQVTNTKNEPAVRKILTDNTAKIETLREITNEEMLNLMRPWVSGGGVLKNYLPKMWEVKFKSESDLDNVSAKITQYGRVLTHADALQAPMSAGWKMIFIAALILGLTLGAITVCISYIARNTAMLHKRELEILNQIGATDSFIARQMQIIVSRICVVACCAGFLFSIPVLLLVLSAAHSARVGLMAMLAISGGGWICLGLMPVAITIFAIWMTRRTTIKILQNE
jgi:cell division protein FtsX